MKAKNFFSFRKEESVSASIAKFSTILVLTVLPPIICLASLIQNIGVLLIAIFAVISFVFFPTYILACGGSMKVKKENSAEKVKNHCDVLHGAEKLLRSFKNVETVKADIIINGLMFPGISILLDNNAENTEKLESILDKERQKQIDLEKQHSELAAAPPYWFYVWWRDHVMTNKQAEV